MRKPVRLGSALVAWLALVACDSAPKRMADLAAPEAGVAFFGGSLATPPPPAPGPDRKVVRNASLRVEVKDAKGAAAEAAKLAEAASGLLASSSLSESRSGGSSAELQLRVPAASIDSTIEKLKALGRTTYEATSARDVTREYVDVETRVRVKRDTEARLRDLLKTAGAKVSDVVEVERELDRVITEIERMEAERRVLESQVALATIDATFYERGALRGDGFLDKLRDALGSAGEVLGTSLASVIYIVLFVGPWMAIAAGLFWFVRLLRRRHL